MTLAADAHPNSAQTTIVTPAVSGPSPSPNIVIIHAFVALPTSRSLMLQPTRQSAGAAAPPPAPAGARGGPLARAA
jgi:hypothetical protein